MESLTDSITISFIIGKNSIEHHSQKYSNIYKNNT